MLWETEKDGVCVWAGGTPTITPAGYWPAENPIRLPKLFLEINNNLRISKEDAQFCEEQENQYKSFINFSNEYIKYGYWKFICR